MSVFHQFTFHSALDRHIRAGARKGIWPSFLYATHSLGTAVTVQTNAEKSWISVCSLFFNPAMFQKQYQLLLCHDPRKVWVFFLITALYQKIKDQTWHFVWKCGTRETKKVRVWCIAGFWLGRCTVWQAAFSMQSSGTASCSILTSSPSMQALRKSQNIYKK